MTAVLIRFPDGDPVQTPREEFLSALEHILKTEPDGELRKAARRKYLELTEGEKK